MKLTPALANQLYNQSHTDRPYLKFNLLSLIALLSTLAAGCQLLPIAQDQTSNEPDTKKTVDWIPEDGPRLISIEDLIDETFESSETKKPIDSTPLPKAKANAAEAALLDPILPSISKSKFADDTALLYEDHPISADLWDRIRAGFSLELSLNNKRIITQRNWYIEHRSYLARVLKRAQPYLHYIVTEIEKRKLPLELALLPVVESAYDPFAYSRSQAAGIWQFIPSTAAIYGMKPNWWYDGRRDIITSTQAALAYLEKLNITFEGDWYLALASYNAGAGTVKRAIRHNQQKGKPVDYWSLPLSKETRHYVPKLLAIAQIVQNPHLYSVNIEPINNQPYFSVVETGGQIDLSMAADLSGIPLKKLYQLNPGFNRWASNPKGPHRLLVPATKAEKLYTALLEIPPERRIQWKYYKIRPGDTLINISEKYNTSTKYLMQANHLKTPRIRAGDSLLIPIASRKQRQYLRMLAQRKKMERAKKHEDKTKTYYTVKHGDTLWSISQQLGVNVQALMQDNDIKPSDTLSIGDQLVVWLDTNTIEALTPALHAGPTAIRKINYMVRSGDSLHAIANRFNITVNDITQWNTLDQNKYLQPGQTLTLYIDVTKSLGP